MKIMKKMILKKLELYMNKMKIKIYNICLVKSLVLKIQGQKLIGHWMKQLIRFGNPN